MTRKIVLIEWLDSRGLVNEWEFLEDIKPLTPFLCMSIGFLLEEKEDYITIVQNTTKDQILGRMTIPRCAIKEIKDIAEYLVNHQILSAPEPEPKYDNSNE